jgi:hypothetical protein
MPIRMVVETTATQGAINASDPPMTKRTPSLVSLRATIAKRLSLRSRYEGDL